MPLAERTAFVKKLSKKLRKENGLKESDNENDNGGSIITFDSKKNEPVDLFNNSSDKGEWYFYNAALKSKGVSDFKRKWGTRTNADNWRRKGAAEKIVNNEGLNVKPEADQGDIDGAIVKKDGKTIGKQGKEKEEIKKVNQQDVSYLGLMANLPLGKDKLQESNTLIAVNLFELAKLIQTELEDYQQAINAYDTSLKRFPDSLYDGGIYLGLYYCYNKLGNTEKANYYKNLLNTKFAGSAANKIITNPLSGKPAMKNSAGTKRYEDIYTLFIEGKFKEALSEKKKADSLYGNNFWSPQLLYIESVYHIKEHQDSAAISILNNIIKLYPKSQLTPKAERMIDVLNRRKEIEEYLTALQVTRMPEDSIIDAPREKLVRNDANLIVTPKRFDSSKTVAPKNIKAVPGISVVPDMVIAKDTVKKVATVKPDLVITKDSIKKSSPVISDKMIAKKPTIKVSPVIPDIVIAKDTIKKITPVLVNASFVLDVSKPQNVIMLLDKVDGTYVNESKNAFTRYVTENFKGQPIVITKNAIDKDVALLVFTSFANADDALQFLNKLKKAAPDEVSWLPAAKYSFLIISDANLILLQSNKNLKAYKDLLNKQFPGKF